MRKKQPKYKNSKKHHISTKIAIYGKDYGKDYDKDKSENHPHPL